jgi:hypothetical protein
MQRVLEMIRQEVAADRVQIDVPTQNLESYFLGVVARARAGEQHTSGALSGSAVAAYLRGEAEQGNHTERVLERLTHADSSTPKADSAAAAPAVDQAKLAGLAQSPLAAPMSEKPAPKPEPAADLARANEKLSALTSKPKE